ncbi:MAG: hypothetical protein H7306_17190 [Bacteriovorax sp.]|nr:hypothetical protein [Rhizobacter sp.]
MHSEQLVERVMRLDRLDRPGYRGDYSFEIFNDDSQQMPLATPPNARAARRCGWAKTCCTARCPAGAHAAKALSLRGTATMRANDRHPH